MKILELPPRTRRIPFLDFTHMPEDRTTSAHAENTTPPRGSCENPRNYLRARGEYCSTATANSGARELPPRTRRIPATEVARAAQSGTTSAHAENTAWICSRTTESWNYLRARGEYRLKFTLRRLQLELPPRTRRIPMNSSRCFSQMGTTSAHAENTGRGTVSYRSVWNYLRARGEYSATSLAAALVQELPPRTRRIHGERVVNHGGTGTTSAHAENT